MAAEDDRPASERIAKVIARAGLCSRREAESWIAAGRVAVNGEVVASPARNVTAADRVTVDGRPLPSRERTRVFLYHKPRGLLTSHADPGGRPTIFNALPKDLPRLISIGRLDINTEGLLLLTNDGALARVLELPATAWLRRYRVRAHGRVTPAELERLSAGITPLLGYCEAECLVSSWWIDRLHPNDRLTTLASRSMKAPVNTRKAICLLLSILDLVKGRSP